jgi:ParB/Sulfiredoxin domain
MKMKISEIIIGNRFRRDLGDIDALAETIHETGLIQPICISEDNKLIAGQRRIEAFKKLGLSDIPVNIIPLKDLIKGEFIENSVRKNFTVSERVAILEEIESQRIGHRQSKNNAKKGGNLPPFPFLLQKGKKSRNIVAEYTGISPRQLSTEKKVIDFLRRNQAVEDEKLAGMQEKLDRGKIPVNKAYKIITKYQAVQKLLNENPVIQFLDSESEEDQGYGVYLSGRAYKAEPKPFPPFPEGPKLLCTNNKNENWIEEIADNSIALMFVDVGSYSSGRDGKIPYKKKIINLSNKVLKEGGSLVLDCSQNEEVKLNTVDFMVKNGFEEWPDIIIESKILDSSDWRYERYWKRLLHFVNGDKIIGGGRNYYKKHTVKSELDRLIARLTCENDTVLHVSYTENWEQEEMAKATLLRDRHFIGVHNDYKDTNYCPLISLRRNLSEFWNKNIETEMEIETPAQPN